MSRDFVRQNVFSLLQAPGSEYAELWESIHYKRFLFRIRAKSEMYQDEMKVKWIVQAVQPFMPDKVVEQFRPLVDNLSMI